jgi:hypothetical protein
MRSVLLWYRVSEYHIILELDIYILEILNKQILYHQTRGKEIKN